MAKKLAVAVHVHQEDGSVVVYQAGDTPPADDSKRITNPAAWGEDDSEEKSADRPTQRKS